MLFLRENKKKCLSIFFFGGSDGIRTASRPLTGRMFAATPAPEQVHKFILG